MSIILLAVYICAVLHQNVNGYRPRVVGGQYSSIDDFPHAVALLVHCFRSDDADYWSCTSSIVNEVLILTAAHCTAGCSEDSHMLASAGDEDIIGFNLLLIHGYLTHEDYKEGATLNDICLVRLQDSLSFGFTVNRIALGRYSRYDNEVAKMAGWGAKSEDPMIYGDKLKSITQYVLPDQFCLSEIGVLPKGTFCAMSGHKEQFPSLGDSGGALVIHDYLQIGLVSYKVRKTADMTVYTDTGYFYDWVSNASEAILNDCFTGEEVKPSCMIPYVSRHRHSPERNPKNLKKLKAFCEINIAVPDK